MNHHIDENKENLSKTPTVDGSEYLEGYKGIYCHFKSCIYFISEGSSMFLSLNFCCIKISPSVIRMFSHLTQQL